MHLNYVKLICPHCGRHISRPNINRHMDACPKNPKKDRT